MALSREAILAAQDVKVEEHDVPEWGGAVWLKVMSGADRESYEAPLVAAKEGETPPHVRANLLARTLCGEDGKTLFSPADIELLEQKNSEVLNRLFLAAAKLNRLGKDDLDAAVKGSGPAMSALEPTPSPNGSGA